MYCGFDPSIGAGLPNIISIWGKTTPKEKLPKRYITITDDEKAKILKYPNHFRVDHGKLIEVKSCQQTDLDQKRAKERVIEKRNLVGSLFKPLTIENRTYHLDANVISNININLNIGHVYPDRKTKIWCLVDSVWIFKEHDLKMLADILIAFDDRRVDSSLNFYNVFGN